MSWYHFTHFIIDRHNDYQNKKLAISDLLYDMIAIN